MVITSFLLSVVVIVELSLVKDHIVYFLTFLECAFHLKRGSDKGIEGVYRDPKSHREKGQAT